MFGKVNPAIESDGWLAESLWDDATALSGYPDGRGAQLLAGARWLRRLGERDGRDALDTVNRALANDALSLPGEILAVAPDPMLVPVLRSIVQARLRHFDVAKEAGSDDRLLFPGWSDFHLYARFAAMPIARSLLAVEDPTGAIAAAIDNLAAAALLVSYAIDAPAIYRCDRRVLIPGHFLAASGAVPADLAPRRAAPAMRGAYILLSRRARELLSAARAGLRKMHTGPERRLAIALHKLTMRLAMRLARRDAQARQLRVTMVDRWRCRLAL